ncbi:hypothetical protein MKZ38_009251 [Zalerion maritima]|uniref:Uncharacterized protein n=1 Tax=Zalerion maritima TaxID=339359 RepID=A0AAD5RUC1_9PEZI|nr:hypothetical protein MKZ38_009251 [Zalerion maritima]
MDPKASTVPPAPQKVPLFQLSLNGRSVFELARPDSSSRTPLGDAKRIFDKACRTSVFAAFDLAYDIGMEKMALFSFTDKKHWVLAPLALWSYFGFAIAGCFVWSTAMFLFAITLFGMVVLSPYFFTVALCGGSAVLWWHGLRRVHEYVTDLWAGKYSTPPTKTVDPEAVAKKEMKGSKEEVRYTPPTKTKTDVGKATSTSAKTKLKVDTGSGKAEGDKPAEMERNPQQVQPSPISPTDTVTETTPGTTKPQSEQTSSKQTAADHTSTQQGTGNFSVH